jgi:hypothetical protein
MTDVGKAITRPEALRMAQEALERRETARAANGEACMDALGTSVGGAPVHQDGVTALAGAVRALLGGGSVGAAIGTYAAMAETEPEGSYWNEYFGRVADALRLLWRVGGEALCRALVSTELAEQLCALAQKEREDG